MVCGVGELAGIGFTTDHNILSLDSDPIGVLRAGVCFAVAGSRFSVIGRNGVAEGPLDREGALSALISADALMLGRPAELTALGGLFADPLTSRNTAFLSTFAPSCAALAGYNALLEQAHVTIVGCGGIGHLVATFAAGFGVKRFLLLDGDVVEPGNLNRQVMYSLSDVGTRKVVALKRVLSERFHGIDAVPGNQLTDMERFVGELPVDSVVVVTGDYPLGLGTSITRRLSAERRAWIDAGYFIDAGVVRSSNEFDGDVTRMTASWSHFEHSIMPSASINNAAIAAEVVRRLGSILLDIEIPSAISPADPRDREVH